MFSKRADKARLEAFADRHRLKVRICAEDGTKIIPGRFGHLYEYSDELLGVIVIPNPPRMRYWGVTRLSLLSAGLRIVQDGDREGTATFDPHNLDQVKAAIRAAGVKRKRQLSPAQREVRIGFLRSAQERHLAMAGAHECP